MIDQYCSFFSTALYIYIVKKHSTDTKYLLHAGKLPTVNVYIPIIPAAWLQHGPNPSAISRTASLCFARVEDGSESEAASGIQSSRVRLESPSRLMEALENIHSLRGSICVPLISY